MFFYVFLEAVFLQSRVLDMEYHELTISFCRLFDEISLLRNQGTWAGYEWNLVFGGCGSRMPGMVIYITVGVVGNLGRAADGSLR